MTKQVQRRRGTAAQHTSFTGAEGEISVNTTNKSVHVHDGTTAGGVEAARADLGNVSDANLNAALSGNTLASLTITSADINGGTIDGTVIGGSTPAAISGTTGAFSSSGFPVVINSTNNNLFKLALQDTAATVGYIGASSAAAFAVGSSAASELFRVSSTGLVGIGTNSNRNSTKLDVLGDVTFGANASYYGTLAYNAGAGFLDITSGDGGFRWFAQSGPTERMRIDASGNLLVGGTTAGNAGTVSINVGNAGATAGGLQMWAGTAQTSFVQFGDESGTAANHYRGYMAYAHGSDSMQFGTASTERLRITSTGSVGIGTSSPNNKAQVSYTSVAAVPSAGAGGHGFAVGDSGFGIAAGALTSGNGYLQATRWDGSATNYNLILQPNGGSVGIGTTLPGNPLTLVYGGGAVGAQIIGNASYAQMQVTAAGADTNSYFTFGANGTGKGIIQRNSTDVITIDASNNVGIGASSPAYKLDVAGVIRSNTGIKSITASGGQPEFVLDQSGVASWTIYNPPSNTALRFYNGVDRMTITSTGSVGIGTSSPAAKLDVLVGGDERLLFGTLGVGNAIYSVDGPNAAYKVLHLVASDIVFRPNGTEHMRITSTGSVGIGTSSPAQPNGSGLVIYDATLPRLTLRNSTTGTASTDGGGLLMSGANLFVTNRENGNLIFEAANATEHMRIDASGNVGIGVVPSAWGTTNRVLQVAGAALSRSDFVDARLNLSNNAYHDNAGNWFYIASFAASRYQQGFGSPEHVWFTAPSGTADGAITWNERMRIDASGNLGLGTSSPAARLHVAGGSARFLSGGSGGIFGDDNTSYFFVQASPTANAAAIYFNGQARSGFESQLHYGASNHVFYNESLSAERARIDASGNLLVGTTSSSAARMDIVSGVNQNTVAMVCPSFNYNVGVFHNQGTSGNNAFVAFGTEASFTFRGSISYNRAGGLTAYNTTSDYRAKDIAGPISDASDAVLSLKPYMGTMKGATVERPMFVAHETQEIAPYAVTGEKDAVDGDGNPKYQQMDHSALVPLLTAALQEALTEIADLKARVAALEA